VIPELVDLSNHLTPSCKGTSNSKIPSLFLYMLHQTLHETIISVASRSTRFKKLGDELSVVRVKFST
jgi:hypothetical protein